MKVKMELSLNVTRNEYAPPESFCIGDLIRITTSDSIYEGEIGDIRYNEIFIFKDSLNNNWIKFDDITDIEYIVA